MNLIKKVNFDKDVLDTLKSAQWNEDGTKCVIVQQLDRKLYEKVNKAFEILGGQWSRKEKAHVFQSDPRDQIEDFLQTGTLEVVRDGFFETPNAVIDRMFGYQPPYGIVLEPSAGMGAIVKWILGAGRRGTKVFCVEKDPIRCLYLQKMQVVVFNEDFLKYDPSFVKFNCIYMNPPFEQGQDIDHVKKAYTLLADDGCLISVMSEGVFYRSDKKSVEFRDWLTSVHGKSEKLPDGSFKESGTMVSTRLIVIRKNAESPNEISQPALF